jgi:hypothetical protein
MSFIGEKLLEHSRAIARLDRDFDFVHKHGRTLAAKPRGGKPETNRRGSCR